MAGGAWCAAVHGVTMICIWVWWCFAFYCNRILQAYLLLALKLAKLKKKYLVTKLWVVWELGATHSLMVPRPLSRTVSHFSKKVTLMVTDLFPLGLTCLISLQFTGLSRVFSNSTVQKPQFFSTQFSL